MMRRRSIERSSEHCEASREQEQKKNVVLIDAYKQKKNTDVYTQHTAIGSAARMWTNTYPEVYHKDMKKRNYMHTTSWQIHELAWRIARKRIHAVE